MLLQSALTSLYLLRVVRMEVATYLMSILYAVYALWLHVR